MSMLTDSRGRRQSSGAKLTQFGPGFCCWMFDSRIFWYSSFKLWLQGSQFLEGWWWGQTSPHHHPSTTVLCSWCEESNADFFLQPYSLSNCCLMTFNLLSEPVESKMELLGIWVHCWAFSTSDKFLDFGSLEIIFLPILIIHCWCLCGLALC